MFEEAAIIFASDDAEAMSMVPALRSFFFDISDVGRSINCPTHFSSALLSKLQPHLQQSYDLPQEMMCAVEAWAKFIDRSSTILFGFELIRKRLAAAQRLDGQV